jgi:cyclopropane fatty-acyl-phospholipid synthase-like methyltransferase
LPNLDYKKIKSFWDNRAKIDKKKDYSVTNLEVDNSLQDLKIFYEKKKIKKYIDQLKITKALDLGSGAGYWSFFLSNYCKNITSVDFSKSMTDLARETALRKGISNISFKSQNIIDFKSESCFDLVYMSGIMIYINDNDIKKLQRNIDDYTNTNSYILLRDGTGKNKQYFINDKYSKELNSNYSAFYRTRRDYINIFKDLGFDLIKDENMFETGSPLNKRKETILRVYLFKKK